MSGRSDPYTCRGCRHALHDPHGCSLLACACPAGRNGLPPDAPAEAPKAAEAFPEATPRPWRWDLEAAALVGREGVVVLCPDNCSAGITPEGDGWGAFIGGMTSDATSEADAALIVAAVNAYDGGAEVERLRKALSEAQDANLMLAGDVARASARVETLEAALREAIELAEGAGVTEVEAALDCIAANLRAALGAAS